MTSRFALRWTLIGLAAVLPLLALAYLLSILRPEPPLVQRSVSVDNLLAAVEMPLDERGGGTQIISNTTLVLLVQPYPPRASVVSTITLVAISAGGQPYTAVNPSVLISDDTHAEPREYALRANPDGSFAVSEVLMPAPGEYRVRVDAYLGDPTPANILFTLRAQ